MSNKEIAKKYLDNLYGIGGISSDVYDIECDEFDNNYDESDFEGKTKNEVKLFILKHLYNVDGISSDVYDMELSELEEEDEFED